MKSGVRFQLQRNGLNPESSPLQLNQHLTGVNLLFGLLGIVELNPYVSLTGTFDIGELYIGDRTTGDTSNFRVRLNGLPLHLSAAEQQLQNEAITRCQEQVQALNQQEGSQKFSESECSNPFFLLQESGFLREFYATIHFESTQWLQLDIGFKNINIGRAFVYDNYALGLFFQMDWSKRPGQAKLPVEAAFQIFLPDSSWTSQGKQSPVAHLRVRYKFAKEDEFFGVFAAYMYDGDNLTGQLLLPLWQELSSERVNQSMLARTGELPQLACYSLPDNDALRAGLSTEEQRQQQACERRNQGKAESEQEACPIDRIFQRYQERYCSTYPSSDGHHTWFGLEGKKSWGPLTFEGSFIVYLSSFQFRVPKVTSGPARRPPRGDPLRRRGQPPPMEDDSDEDGLPELEEINQQGFGLSVELLATYRLLPNLALGGFFLYASGGAWDSQQRQSMNFIGISPQVRYTNLFFTGGINSYSSQRGIDLSGISGRGYIAPGAFLRLFAENKYAVKLTTALLWANAPPAAASFSKNAGTFYGTEINLTASYQWQSWLRPVLQTDLFLPGNFFHDTNGNPAPTSFQLLVGVDFFF